MAKKTTEWWNVKSEEDFLKAAKDCHADYVEDNDMFAVYREDNTMIYFDKETNEVYTLEPRAWIRYDVTCEPNDPDDTMCCLFSTDVTFEEVTDVDIMYWYCDYAELLNEEALEDA